MAGSYPGSFAVAVPGCCPVCAEAERRAVRHACERVLGLLTQIEELPYSWGIPEIEGDVDALAEAYPDIGDALRELCFASSVWCEVEPEDE